MNFPRASVKSPKADLAKGEITIAFVVGMEFLEIAQQLAVYASEEAGTVELNIFPRQMSFAGAGTTTLTFKAEQIQVRAHSRGGKIKKDPDTGEVTEEEVEEE